MKKLILAILAVFVSGTAAFANDGTFGVSATLPEATVVTFITSKVDSTTGIFTPASTGPDSASLSWGTSDLTFLPGTVADPINIWTGNHYYAIDLAPSLTLGGIPAPGSYSSITFDYTGETVPAGQVTGGLGARAVMTPTAVTADGPDTGTDPDEIVITSVALSDADTVTLDNADLLGGFLRVYVGLYTGLPVVPNAVPFTNGDAPGSYGGTLTITATLS